MLLRFLLGAINSQSNDDHFEVISIIMSEKRIPVYEDCRECFQPKLYHLSAALILKIFPSCSLPIQIRIAQFINVIAGGITLYFAYLFLIGLPFSNKLKAICFSLISLNPRLIGINAQATNDSFVILFSTACLYFTFQYFYYGSVNNFLNMVISAILAGLSKGNGLVLFPTILAMFIYRIIFKVKNVEVSRTNQLLFIMIIFFLYLLCVPYFGQYYEKYVKFGDPFIINQEKNPKPHFIKRTYVNRPGVTSIFDSYLTFRIFSLLKTPSIPLDNNKYPLHRTSLWAQLYGRAHFVHFAPWPPGWQTRSRLVQSIGRCIFLLALIPSLFMMVGAIKTIISVFRDIYIKFRYKNKLKYNVKFLFIIVFMAYIFFIIAYSIQYRDFSSMKVIFIFPGILAFLYLLIDGMDFFYQRFSNRKKLIYCLDKLLISLLMLYCIDIFYLEIQLSVQIIIKRLWFFLESYLF